MVRRTFAKLLEHDRSGEADGRLITEQREDRDLLRGEPAFEGVNQSRTEV